MNQTHIAAAIAVQSGAPKMMLGMNMGWISAWTGAVHYANLMYQARVDRVSGSGAWSANQGIITTSDPSAIFRITLADRRSYIPKGTYTILNPSGAQVAMSNYSAPSEASYTTASQFTFTIDSSTDVSAMCLFVKGTLVNTSGNLCVICPNHLDSWNSGNIWHSDLLAYYALIKPAAIRFMDAISTNTNIEQNWYERSQETSIILKSNWVIGENSMPYEHIIDLCNRVNANPWVNIPPRATQAYVQSMAALFAARLNSNLQVIPEYGNEIWNTANTFAIGTGWVTYLGHTKYTATCDYANQLFVQVSHGLTNGTMLTCWTTGENEANKAPLVWQLDYGTDSYVKVITADTFELYSDAALTTKISFDSAHVNVVYVNRAEPGKTADRDGNYARKCIEIWDAFDSAMGVSRVKHLISSMAADTGVTSARMAVSGISSRVDYVAIAPYFSGPWVSASATVADGSITPAWWCNKAKTVTVSVYAAGSTPTRQQKLDGTGAVSRTLAAFPGTSSSYAAGTIVSGLTNGTSYDVYFLYDDGGFDFELKITATPSATSSTSYVYDSYANQQARARNASIAVGYGYINNHKALIPSRSKMVCYEGGLDFGYPSSVPAGVAAWRDAYLESQNAADAITYDLNTISSTGCGLFMYYFDVAGTAYRTTTSYSDLTTKRLGALASKSGRVKRLVRKVLPDLLFDNVLAAPSMYPHQIGSFSDTSYTYSIIGGDTNGNMSISGASLRIDNSTNINWSAPTSKNVYVEGSKNGVSDVFLCQFSLGDSWYQADSKFVWSTLTDTDTTQADPIIGSAIPRTSGTVYATASGGLWDLDGVRYTNNTGQISTSPLSTPILVAIVANKDNHTSNGVRIFQAGSAGAFIAFDTTGTNSNNISLTLYSGSGKSLTLPANLTTTSAVFWCYFDGVNTMYGGVNQSASSMDTTGITLTNALPRDIRIGGASADCLAKIGSIQVLSRAGLTLTDAKAIVAKMQALHGIS